MTTLLVLCCFSFLLAGVFGADVTVTVIKEDSVTLPINPDEIKGAEKLLWTFKDKIIATIDLEVIHSPAEYPNERFRGRLNLDTETGSLTINNIRTEDKGEYKLEISGSGKPKSKTFSVIINDEVESKSGKVGTSLTLNINTETQADDVIEWKFENTLIAKVNRTAHPHPDHVLDKRFRDRLDVNLFGSLIITHIKTEDSGLYHVIITNSNHIIQKRFNLTVTGVFSADVAVSAMKGYPVTLLINPDERKGAEKLFWKFNNTNIATIDLELKNSKQYPDKEIQKFSGRLNPDPTTGSLTINNIRTDDKGDYKLEIKSGVKSKYKTFSVTVNDKPNTVSVIKEDTVTLPTGVNIQPNDVQWKFKGTIIANLTHSTISNMDVNPQTGNLNIRYIKLDQSGEYEVEINGRGFILLGRYRVSVSDKVESISELEGETLTLDATTQTPADVIEWKFENTTIAKMDRTAHPHSDFVPVKRFRGRLDVNWHGSLIIKKLKTEDSGPYDVKIINSNHIIQKRFSVTVTESTSRSHQLKIGPGLFVVVIMLVIALVMPVTGDD